MSQYEESWRGIKSSKSANQLYAEAFGEESIFKGKTLVTGANEKPVDELSRESLANAAAAEGLSSIFGHKQQ